MGATGGFIAGGINSYSSAYSQSQAIKAQSSYQRAVAEINSRLSKMQAEDAIDRGEQTARDYKKEVDGMIGLQRVAYAAQGVDVNYGTAMDVQQETRYQGERAVLNIKSNAWQEAWGYEVQGMNSSFAGEFAKLSGDSQAKQTLISGGMNAVGYGMQAYGSYQKNNPSTTTPKFMSTASTQTPVAR